MSLNGIQLYLKGVYDGLTLPSTLGTLTAYVTPPSPDDPEGPVLYIWGGRQSEKRLTVPRAPSGNLSGGGSKRIDHTIDLWLMWFGMADDPQADSMFPLVVEKVASVLRNLPMPQNLTDATTGAGFVLHEIGEEFDTDISPVHQLADQRMYLYNAHLSCTAVEIIQA